MDNRRIQTDREIRYRLCVGGAFAGLISWFIGVWIPFLITLPEAGPRLTASLNSKWLFAILGAMPKDDGWIIEVLDASLIGLFLGVCYVIFADRLSGTSISIWERLWRILKGAGGGGLAGTVGIILSYRPRFLWLGAWPRTGNLLAWCLIGAAIGLVVGLISYKWVLRYVLLSVFGSLVGAAIGGGLLLLGGELFPHFRAVGLSLTGFFVCFFSTFAVRLASGATLQFLSSGEDAVNEQFSGREWDLLENIRYVFGREEAHEGLKPGTFYLAVGDSTMAPRHAEICGHQGVFKLSPCKENRPGKKNFRNLEVGSPLTEVEGDYTLQDQDELVMGQTRFVFRLRKKAVVIGLCGLAIVLNSRVAFAQADESRLALLPDIQMLRVESGSETVVFRVSLNIIDAQGKPQKISAFSPEEIEQGLRVFEGAEERKICHISFGSLPRRYAILLVDVSGSMLELTGDKRRKFDVMKEACLKFAEDFVQGVDYIAVIPFHSHGVIEGIQKAHFFTSKIELQNYISQIPAPLPVNNTALYSAARAALDKLLQIKREQEANAQYLLVIMTDGKNDVRADDDKGLDTDVDAMIALKRRADLPIISIGFGNDQNLNPKDLREMASPNHYFRAYYAGDLVMAFQQARSLQLDRFHLTFFPQPNLLSQMVSPHTYLIQLSLGGRAPAEGLITWSPKQTNVPQGFLPPEERQCLPPAPSGDWLRPFLMFGFLFGLFTLLWFRPPRRIRNSWEKEEAELVWLAHITELKKWL